MTTQKVQGVALTDNEEDKRPLPQRFRLLHIIPNFGLGGAEKLVMDLALSYDKKKFDVAVCSLFPEGDTWIENELKKREIRIFYLNKRLGLDLKILAGLIEVFKIFKPDVVHTHLYALCYVLLPSLIFRVSVKIHTVHNIADKEIGAMGRVVHGIAFKFCKVYPVAISQAIGRTVEAQYKLKVFPCIYNGVPTETYRPIADARKVVRALLELSSDQFVCLHIGRFSPQKNHRLLIEAFAGLLAEIPNAVLLLAGGGELRSEIERLAECLGLGKNIRFLGLRKDVPELLAASDVLILSSDWEGVPLVVLEAMAAEKPVVATTVGGIPELVVHEETGLLIPPRDTVALSGAIKWIFKNPSKADEMGKRGREIVKVKFDIKAMTEGYEALYLHLIGK